MISKVCHTCVKGACSASFPNLANHRPHAATRSPAMMWFSTWTSKKRLAATLESPSGLRQGDRPLHPFCSLPTATRFSEAHDTIVQRKFEDRFKHGLFRPKSESTVVAAQPAKPQRGERMNAMAHDYTVTGHRADRLRSTRWTHTRRSQP